MNQVCELGSDSSENRSYSNQIATKNVTESKDKNHDHDHDHGTMIENRNTKGNHNNNDLTTNAN